MEEEYAALMANHT
jgi:hypothetical protein